jgi:uncharacterized protein YidB (DUF937 family)
MIAAYIPLNNQQESNMGLFDSVVGGVLNNMGDGNGAQGGDIMQMVMGLMQQNGGLAGLVEMFNKSGLSRQAASWVGTGDNLPVSADQISSALGSGPLAELAGKFGIDPQQLSGSLAQYLPEVVNQMTPNGRLPDNAGDTDALGQGLNALAGKLFG